MASIPEPYTREETVAQSADRRFGELLQELRVTQTGIQVLLGFLFTVVFSNRFKELNGDQRVMYLTTLIFGASAVAVLIAPVSFHRILFGLRMKPELVRVANLLTLLGLGLLMCTIASALLLVFDFMLHGSAVAWLAAGVTAWFVLLWYLVPLALRFRRAIEWEEEPDMLRGGERKPAMDRGTEPKLAMDRADEEEPAHQGGDASRGPEVSRRRAGG